MVRRDASTLRQERINTIRKQMLFSLKDILVVDKLLDWVEINIGLTRETAKGYIDLIVRTEGWVEVDGRIAFSIDDLK